MTFAFPEKDAETFDDDFEAEKKSKKKNKKSKVGIKTRTKVEKLFMITKVNI